MPSQQILPVTHHPYPFSGPNPSSIDAMLVKVEDDPTASLLVSSSFEDEKASSSFKPVLPRASSYTCTSISTSASASSSTTTTATKAKSFYQKRRRRAASEDSLSSLSDGENRRSLGRQVGHAAAETFLLTRLGLKLLRYLGWVAVMEFLLVFFYVGILFFVLGLWFFGSFFGYPFRHFDQFG